MPAPVFGSPVIVNRAAPYRMGLPTCPRAGLLQTRRGDRRRRIVNSAGIPIGIRSPSRSTPKCHCRPTPTNGTIPLMSLAQSHLADSSPPRSPDVPLAQEPPSRADLGRIVSGGMGGTPLAQRSLRRAGSRTDQVARLKDNLRIFIAEKEWFGCDGLIVTDEMRVTIAALACLLVLEITPTYHYDRVKSVLIYPKWFLQATPRWGVSGSRRKRPAGRPGLAPQPDRSFVGGCAARR